MEKRNKASRDQNRRNSSLKIRSQKSVHPVWDFGLSVFFQNREYDHYYREGHLQ
jgi:hypothetical protein